MGIGLIRILVVVGGAAAFAYLYGTVIWDVWPAETKVTVDKDDVKIATALAGALGALFALALGVERQEQKREEGDTPRSETLAGVGRTLTGDVGWKSNLAATVAVWVYFLVGIAAIVTWYFNRDQTPELVKTLAEGMAGYILAIIASLAVTE